MNKIIVLVGFLLACCNVQASYRHYEAKIENSMWSSSGNKLQCKLTHKVPGYGDAVFTSTASFHQNLLFELYPIRNTAFNEGKAVVKTIAPEWQANELPSVLGEVNVYKGKSPFYIKDKLPWKMLLALETGMTPAVYYDGWVDSADLVAVALSGVNFTQAYDEFNSCVSQLLPYDFDDIKTETVYFNYEKYYLTKETKESLDKIIEYVEVENNLDKIIITGHADAKGPARFNKWIAEARAISVRDYLREKGITPKRYIVRTLGEKHPIDTNDKKKGRANNRRVFIQLIKE